MLLYICTCLVLSGVVKSAQVKPKQPTFDKLNNDAPKQADAIFADVIKNISRVNNVLQELINNYEQLQKIYKSQENVESAYSDSEIDEIFKSKNGKKSKRTKEGDEVTLKPNSIKLATQMFWSDHDEDNNDSNEDNDDTKEVKNDKNKKIITLNNTLEPKQQYLPVSRKTTTLKPATSEESSDDSSDKSVSIKKVKHKEKIDNKPQRIKFSNPAKPKQPPAEVIFVDTHKKPREVKSTPKIQAPIQFADLPTKPKTRYSKVSHSNAVNPGSAQNFIPKTGINNTRIVKKTMHAESFSPKKIWDDIINNKPIHLEAHNEITLRRVEEAKRNSRSHNRNKKDKAALVIITDTKKTADQAISSEEDDLTKKEELKTKVLRQAYGDACLKLVLRKCYKAMQRVSKAACNHVKCKSAAKSTFKSFARTACIKEFHGDGNNEAKREEVYPIVTKYRGQNQQGSFPDMTRSGFLSAACLPHVADHKEIVQRNEPPQRTNPDQNFNILRDRFERACKKISSSKCNDACNYAFKKTCETHTCSKLMKKVFKKMCKTQCRRAYELYDRDSDSESESDSDSDSEYESDSDDESSESTD